jgi:hypothetical protein
LEREFVEFVGCRSGAPFRTTTDQVIVADYKVVPGVSRNFRMLGTSRESHFPQRQRVGVEIPAAA